MRKMFVLLAAILVVSTPVLADVVNGDWNTGDETGWTRWQDTWSATHNWAVTFSGPTPPEGTLSLNQGQQGSFGWFQVIPCAVGNICTIHADWAGDIDGAGWAEVDFWTTADPNEDHGLRADTGNAGDIAYKKDSWGVNPPTAWSWQPAELSPFPGGNGGTVVCQGYIVVALKLGSVSGSPVWASFDNIHVTCIPEPGSLLAFGTGLLGLVGFAIRRRK
jgi:hypothetical protein